MGGGGAQKKIQKPARKKKPNFDVDGYPGGETGAAGRHGGSARKKKPKYRRVKKTPKTGAQKKPKTHFSFVSLITAKLGFFLRATPFWVFFARHPVVDSEKE